MIKDTHFAAVDLGSNSFHMVIARLDLGQLHIVDRMREPVRLAAGLDAHNELNEETQRRALDCLRRFSERLQDIPKNNIRAVGTDTLRVARNWRNFLQQAQNALGHTIEILLGVEEARLIYIGVNQDIAANDQRRLVVDIGGGSTECIIGERALPLEAHSFHMGCVNFSRRFFSDGVLSNERFRIAEVAAARELRPERERFLTLGFKDCVGASGTISAIENILQQNDWAKGGITRDGLQKLRKALANAGRIKDVSLPGLTDDRAPVLPGGLAILMSIFDAFSLESMTVASGALREGVLYELVGRSQHDDVRDVTVARMAKRYTVDMAQAERVEDCALRCLDQLGADWKLPMAEARQFLRWASRLHEIGLAVAHSGYHKHGAYLIENSDMPGFSKQDSAALAAMVRAHRRKLHPSLFYELSDDYALFIPQCVLILRLAVCLNRSRRLREWPEFKLKIRQNTLELRFPHGWLTAHPMTALELDDEAERFKAMKIHLILS